MLNTLRQIVEEIGRIPLLEDALQRVSVMLTEAMQVDCCAIYLADNENQCFVLVATEGLAKEAIGVTSVGFAEGIIGLIGQREEPINIPDAQSHPRFKHYPEVKEDFYHAFLGAPIIHQRKVLGVLSIQQKSRRRFAEEEEALLITLAAQMALEVANAEARGALKVFGTVTQVWQKALYGQPGSPGLALGIGYQPDAKAKLSDYLMSRTTKAAAEISRYRDAVKKTKADIQKLTQNIASDVPEDVADIFHTYEHLLDAASLGRAVEEKIRGGWNAASGLKQVVENYALQFRQMQDAYMRERAADVVDLGNRVFSWLVNETQTPSEVPENTILVAEEVTATMLAEVSVHNLKGIVAMRGSVNSHAAILARAMGIPAVLGVSELHVSLLAGRELLLDGYSGEITVAPETQKRDSFQQLVNEERELQSKVAEEQQLPAQTKDGNRIGLYLNVGLSQELEDQSSLLADGVGLYRTEIPFMAHDRFPTEIEQMSLYRSLLQRYEGRSVTMRTLDVGGDKPLPYFKFEEENPFLGWRGMRMTLDHPEIFLVQIRAMLRASINLDNLQIMLPMVTSVEEVKEARRLIRQAFYEVKEEANREKQQLHKPKIGVMLEVPSVLYQLRELADLVDFFSVGSNDLTQYLLAVDRNNARVSSLYQSFHPAVLRALADIARQSEDYGMAVTVCGELAAEPGGVMLLVAMGYTKLSINGHSLGQVKWVIRRQSKQRLDEILSKALAMSEAADVKDFINLELETLGLGGLVRAGK